MRSGPHLLAVMFVIGVWSVGAAAWPPTRELHDSCKRVAIDSELGAEPAVRPYVEAARDAGWDILECTYTFHLNPNRETDRGTAADPALPDDRMDGWVVLADPPIATVESWIQQACHARARRNEDGCIAVLQDHILRDNGAQFPIIGFVAEGGPDDRLCWQYGVETSFQGLIAFQDGVTVQRSQDSDGRRKGIYCATDGWGPDIQRRISLTHPISESFRIARLADLPRSCGRDVIRRYRAEIPPEAPFPWLAVTRANHLEAMRTGIDHMMEIQAGRFADGITDLRAECPEEPEPPDR